MKEPIECVRSFIDGNITTGKLLKLVPAPMDLVGCFSNIIDEDRNNVRRAVYAVEQVIANIDNLESAISQLESAIEPLKKGQAKSIRSYEQMQAAIAKATGKGAA